MASNSGATGADDAERRLALRDGVALLEALEIDDERLQSVSERLAAEPTGNALAELENVLLAIDETVAPATFRERFGTNCLAPDALCRYAALLGRHAETAWRFDRIELIAIRLLTREQLDGQLEVLSEADFLRVLERITPPITLTPERRDKSVLFFINAAQRLEGLTSAHDVFNGGLYLDVQGYKRSLRKERLDPGILYAAVLLSVAITNHLMRLAARADVARSVVLNRIAGTDLKVDEIFSASEQLDLAKRKRRKPAATSTAPQPALADAARPNSKASDGRSRRLAVAAGLLFIVVGAAFVVRGPVATQNTLNAIPAATMSTISPLLKIAMLSKGHAKPRLVGQVDEAAWRLLSLEQRKAAAAELIAGIERNGIGGALVYRGKTLVVHVDHGRLILVQ